MNSWKAIAGFVFGFAVALLAQVADKTEFTDLTPMQWVIAVLSATVTAGGVYIIPPGRGLVTPGSPPPPT
jgi:hypothetical protein